MITERDKEINRLYASLKNFLTFGYDGEYQKSESAIEQLTKLRNMASRTRTKRKVKRLKK